MRGADTAPVAKGLVDPDPAEQVQAAMQRPMIPVGLKAAPEQQLPTGQEERLVSPDPLRSLGRPRLFHRPTQDRLPDFIGGDLFFEKSQGPPSIETAVV